MLGGRLTADLVLRSPQGMNCLGDYELCLRGARRRPPPPPPPAHTPLPPASSRAVLNEDYSSICHESRTFCFA